MKSTLVLTSFFLVATAACSSNQDAEPAPAPTTTTTPATASAPAAAEIPTKTQAADELARALRFLHTLPSLHLQARANLNLEGEERPDFAFTITTAAPNQFRIECGESGLLVSDGKQMLRDWFQTLHAIEPAPKSLQDWLRDGPEIHFVSITTLRGLFGASGTVPSLLDAKDVALIGEETINGKPALHLAVRDELLACELWVQKGNEPWLLRYRPKLGYIDQESMSIEFFGGDIWLEVESFSREAPKDAFALVATKNSRRVDDLGVGIMEEQERYAAESEELMAEEGEVMGAVALEDAPAPERRDEKPHPTVGKPAPDVQWTLLDGTSHKLADLKGKVVVLDFWATWCKPCIQGLPKISAIAKSYADQGVVFVACDLEESKSGVAAFLAKKKFEFPCAIVNQKFAKPFGVGGIPHTVMIGKDGVIQKVHIGYGPGQEKIFEADLRELLGLPKAAPTTDAPKPVETGGKN